jgi:hypothetical protein
VKPSVKYLLIIFTIIFLSFIQQDKTERLIIKTRLDYFAIDNIGNIYTVKDEELVKYLPTGKFFVRYSNLKLGNISTVDATNPLKLLLYYRDFQQIVFLDDQLTENSESISLEALGYEQTDQACAGANNSFWIYSKQNNELVRFDENSKKVASTGNLKQVLRTSDLSPNFMLEHNGYLFLNCPETGIYVFDIFGAFSKVIAIKNLKLFQVSENIIYYKKDSALCSYDYKIFEEACKQIFSGSKTTDLKFSKNKVYCGYKDSVVVRGL